MRTNGEICGDQSIEDAPHGRILPEELGPTPERLPMLIDRAYEGNETRQIVLDRCIIPLVSPKSNRLHRHFLCRVPFIRTHRPYEGNETRSRCE
jgi:hypothetical protein